MYLSIDRAKYGHDTLYVKKSFRKDNGRTSSKVVENLGRLEDLAKLHEDPIAWAKAYIDELNAKEREATRSVMLAYLPTRRIEAGLQRVFNGGYLFLQQVYNELGINRICKPVSICLIMILIVFFQGSFTVVCFVLLLSCRRWSIQGLFLKVQISSFIRFTGLLK